MCQGFEYIPIFGFSFATFSWGLLALHGSFLAGFCPNGGDGGFEKYSSKTIFTPCRVCERKLYSAVSFYGVGHALDTISMP